MVTQREGPPHNRHPGALEGENMKKRLTTAVVLGILLAMALPASAITKGGSPDDGEHPYVGLMVALAEDGTPLWRCSGSLISSTVYVTAGHCTEAPAATAAIWFDEHEEDIRNGGYPFPGGTAVTGTTHTHPSYDPNAFFLFDLGVVVLDEPVELSEYAELPEEGAVDDIGHGRKSAAVEAVGYGLQRINPSHLQADLEKMKADLFIVDRTGVAGLKRIFGFVPGSGSFIMSGDASGGGTCFGDSGGPILRGDSNVIVGVTSFGLNANCAGIGGAYRIDQPDDLEFIGSFLQP